MIKIKLILFILLTLLLISCDQTVGPQEPFTCPSNLSITKIDYGCLRISWQDNTNREMQYQVDRRVGAGEWEIEFLILPANTVSFTDTDLSVSTDYSYRVFAYNFDECSGYTEASFFYEFIEVDTITPDPYNETIIIPNQSTFLSFYLIGENGESPDLDYEVWSEIISAPAGTSLSNNYQQGDLISQPSSGYLSLRVSAGHTEGTIKLKMYTFKTTGEEVTFEFEMLVNYPEVSQIDLISEDFNLLYPNESKDISVELKSSYWSVVQEEYELFYQFIEKPYDTNINGTMYIINEPYPLTTIDGRATVTLNSGEGSGNIELKIFTFTSLGDEISLTKNYGVVSNNDAEYCFLNHGGVDEGLDVDDRLED